MQSDEPNQAKKVNDILPPQPVHPVDNECTSINNDQPKISLRYGPITACSRADFNVVAGLSLRTDGRFVNARIMRECAAPTAILSLRRWVKLTNARCSSRAIE